MWHSEKLGAVPNVNANEGYRFTGNWTDGTNTYTADQLKEVEISSDRTFTAEVKQLYSLTYDLNGGSGAAAPEASKHIEGEKVSPDYSNTGNLKKGEDTIFVGWSEEQIPDPLQEDAAQADIKKIISADEHTMPARNVTLYAVYAVDGNGNGNPDYNDNSVHVRYHGNNGDYTDILCPHHHVAGATAKLSTSGTVSGKSLNHDKPASDASGEVTSHTFTFTDKTTGNAHIFIGWSTTPILDTVIETNKQYEELQTSIVTEVMMEKAEVAGGNADADGNTNVYAVWAADRNGNKTADYLEEHTLTYDGNAQQGGTVKGLPRDTNIYIPKDTVTLSTNKPTHDEVDSKRVVFIGWTETQTNFIYSSTDKAPKTVMKVTFENDNKTVYAAWGYDEDQDGTADVLNLSLTYNPNGGEGAAGETYGTVKVKLGENHTVKAAPSRSGYEFVGWKDNNGRTYQPGDNLIVNNDITLTAAWKNIGGGSGGGGGSNKPNKPTDPSKDRPAKPSKVEEVLNTEDHFQYVQGYPDNTVAPERNITRAEATVIFFRLLNDSVRTKYLDADNVFSDVNLNDWFNLGVSTMENSGFVSGYDDGLFRPNAYITRAELATIISNFDDLEPVAENKFADVEGHWAEKYINSAAEKGWLSGYEDGLFRPNQHITRAETMSMINRVLNRRVDANGLHAAAKQWKDNPESKWYYYAVLEATNNHEYERANVSDYENWTAIKAEKTWEN